MLHPWGLCGSGEDLGVGGSSRLSWGLAAGCLRAREKRSRVQLLNYIKLVQPLSAKPVQNGGAKRPTAYAKTNKTKIK